MFVFIQVNYSLVGLFVIKEKNLLIKPQFIYFCVNRLIKKGKITQYNFILEYWSNDLFGFLFIVTVLTTLLCVRKVEG